VSAVCYAECHGAEVILVMAAYRVQSFLIRGHLLLILEVSDAPVC